MDLSIEDIWIESPPRDYQPSTAELNEGYDIPEATLEVIHRAFFWPVEVKKPRDKTD